MKRFVLCVLVACLLTAWLLPLSAQAQAQNEEVDVKKSLIWSRDSDDGKYPRHRIPGIVVTKKNTVIIYCEARTGNTEYSLYDKNDWCLMDIYIQRSTDGGETFGEPIYIAKGTQQYATVNNPVMIVGNDNTLHMLFCRNYGMHGAGIWYRKSTDDGLTWTEERELTEFAESTPHNRIAFGPTHGICTREGRLMTPVWMTEPAHAYLFYSDDNGETWAMSEPASNNTNETNVAQLSDGSILLNSRAKPQRKITTSPDGVSNWTTTHGDIHLPDPGCCAGMTTVDLAGLPYAMLFVNCATTDSRTQVTLRCSFDDGNSFPKQVMICEDGGGYSDVAVDSNGTVYVLYEVNWGGRVYLARLDFFDAFCADEAEAMTSAQTQFDLRGEEALSLVREHLHTELSAEEGGLRFTVAEKGQRSTVLDFSSLSYNLNLSKQKAVAVTLRLQCQAEHGRHAVEFGFSSGRDLVGTNGRRVAVQIPADGKFHTVILDLSALPAAKGSLRSMRLDFCSDVFINNEGDFMELASVSFYPDAAQAQADLQENIPDATDPTAPTVSEGGCASLLGIFPVVITTAAAPIAARRCKRKKQNDN